MRPARRLLRCVQLMTSGTNGRYQDLRNRDLWETSRSPRSTHDADQPQRRPPGAGGRRVPAGCRRVPGGRSSGARGVPGGRSWDAVGCLRGARRALAGCPAGACGVPGGRSRGARAGARGVPVGRSRGARAGAVVCSHSIPGADTAHRAAVSRHPGLCRATRAVLRRAGGVAAGGVAAGGLARERRLNPGPTVTAAARDRRCHAGARGTAAARDQLNLVHV